MLSLKAFLGLDASGFELGIKRAQSVSDKFAASVSRGITNRIGGFLTAAAATAAAHKMANLTSEIKNMAERLGIGTDEWQKWEFAASQAGAKGASVAKFFEALAVSRDRALGGDEKTQGKFTAFGVTQSDLRSKSLQDIGRMVGDAFANGDQQKMLAPLKEIGGRAAVELAAAFRSGLGEAFSKAPLISEDQIQKIDALGNAFDRFGKRLIASAAPGLTAIIDKLNKVREFTEYMAGRAGAFLGNFVVSKSLTQAAEAAQKAGEEITKAQADENSKKPSKIERGMADDISSSPSKNEPTKVAKEIAEQTAKKSGAPGANINSLQQVGALVQRPHNPFSELAANTMATKENTAAIRSKASSPDWKHLVGALPPGDPQPVQYY